VVGPESLNAALLSHSDLFVTNLVQKMMVYALGRAVDYHDMPAVRTIIRQAQRDNLRFSALVLGIAQSAPFHQQTGSPPGGALTARE
jgi:hypothetical protein